MAVEFVWRRTLYLSTERWGCFRLTSAPVSVHQQTAAAAGIEESTQFVFETFGIEKWIYLHSRLSTSTAVSVELPKSSVMYFNSLIFDCWMEGNVLYFMNVQRGDKVKEGFNHRLTTSKASLTAGWFVFIRLTHKQKNKNLYLITYHIMCNIMSRGDSGRGLAHTLGDQH